MRARTLGVVLSLLMFASSARADMITIRGTDFASGTDLTTAIDGVSMWSLRSGLWGPPMTVVPYTPVRTAIIAGGGAALGTGSFLENFLDCSQGGRCSEQWHVLEVQFDTPTNVVEMTGIWRSDSPGMYAFDVDGNLIGTCWSLFGSNGGGCATSGRYNDEFWFTRLTVDTGQRNIASVVFAGLVNWGTATEVSYGVPEPGTGLLALMGIAGLVRLARARDSSS